jgi:hypothetical protein
MKIKTNLRAGNIMEDAYRFVRQTLEGIPQFINKADDEAKMLYEQAADSTQELWGKLTSLF